MATAVLENTSTFGQNSVSSIPIPVPTGVTEGELLVSGLLIQNGSRLVNTVPSGWNFIDETKYGAGSEPKLRTYYKQASNSEPADYTWELDGTSHVAALMVRISGASIPHVDISEAAETSVITLDIPTVSTTNDNGLSLIFALGYDITQAIAPTATGYTNHDNAFGGVSRLSILSKSLPISGSTGTVTLDYNPEEQTYAYGQHLAINSTVIRDTEGCFEAGIKFQGTALKDFHTAAGRFEAGMQFTAAIGWHVAGRFEAGVQFNHTGSLKDYLLQGRFEAGVYFSGILRQSIWTLAGRFEVGIKFNEAYVGRGTGLTITGGSTDSEMVKFLESLREGDEFPVYLPFGGLEGKTGIARLLSRRYQDGQEFPDYEIEFIEQAHPKVINRLKEDTIVPTIPKRAGNLWRSVAELKRSQNKE